MRRVYRDLNSRQGSDDQEACGFAPASRNEANQVIEIAVHIRLGDRELVILVSEADDAPLKKVGLAR